MFKLQPRKNCGINVAYVHYIKSMMVLVGKIENNNIRKIKTMCCIVMSDKEISEKIEKNKKAIL